jgi:hypothetical protein
MNNTYKIIELVGMKNQERQTDKHRTLKLIRRTGLGEKFKKTSTKYDLMCSRPRGLIPNNIVT